jgi:hypothetical protein
MSCCGKKTLAGRIKAAVLGWSSVVFRVGLASRSEIAERRGKCRVCPHSTKHPSLKTKDGLPMVGICKLCKCPIGVKTQRKKAACPEEKW